MNLDFIKKFPLPALREKQSFVLKEIDTALASGYKYILLEAPTRFGKSPVGIAIARTLGTSYICTSTKDLHVLDYYLHVAVQKQWIICVDCL